MIFYQDRQTVVYHHAADYKENIARVKEGTVHRSGWYPKPGLLKVFAQVDWCGAIRTFGLGVKVK